MTACATAKVNNGMNLCLSARISLVQGAAQLAVSICVRLIAIVIRLWTAVT